MEGQDSHQIVCPILVVISEKRGHRNYIIHAFLTVQRALQFPQI